MKVIVENNGDITIISDSGAETFVLKRYREGVKLVSAGVYVAPNNAEAMTITIAPSKQKTDSGSSDES